jgi:predicted dehydrogenase
VAPGYGDLFRIELSGERGTVAVDSEHPESVWLRTHPEPPRAPVWSTDPTPQPLPADFPSRRHPPSPSAVVPAIRGEAVDYPTFADGVRAQRVLAALEASMRTRAWAPVG